MSYLRFTPDEYRMIVDLCREQRLGGRNQPTFRRLLVASLQAVAPTLANRVARLRRGEIDLLYFHFWERTPPVAASLHDFTPVEMRLIEEACVTAPFSVRFVRPFKRILVELFENEWPDLARKLTMLSGHKFERLYEEVCESRRRTS